MPFSGQIHGQIFNSSFCHWYAKALESGGPAEADDMLIIEPFYS